MTTEVKKSRGHLALIIATLIFGLNGPFSKILLSPGGITPEVHILVRFVGATFLFWLTSYFLPSELVRKKDRYKILAASLLGVLGNQGIFALGISMTSPVDQSLISTLGPIITMILAAIFLHEHNFEESRRGFGRGNRCGLFSYAGYAIGAIFCLGKCIMRNGYALLHTLSDAF
ncbi:DMT family transporter [Porphyromonas macacae]|uniref:DMT family transporter n=1 Tax=Porphyromonas macacae TaxID=28115 RepID=UPI000A72B522|nr:DMT family transporter [Porphyromonas macacae]